MASITCQSVVETVTSQRDTDLWPPCIPHLFRYVHPVQSPSVLESFNYKGKGPVFLSSADSRQQEGLYRTP